MRVSNTLLRDAVYTLLPWKVLSLKAFLAQFQMMKLLIKKMKINFLAL